MTMESEKERDEKRLAPGKLAEERNKVLKFQILHKCAQQKILKVWAGTKDKQPLMILFRDVNFEQLV